MEKMRMDKKTLMESEFGQEMQGCITAWDTALQSESERSEKLRDLAWCQAQWEVYQLALKHFYGVEYHFTRTDEYYGLCTEDESDFLMKVDREQINSPRYEAAKEDIKAAMRRTREMQRIAREYKPNATSSNDRTQRREALRKALQETMEIVLESELFTNAAKRGIEDYEFIVSHNILMMTDSVLGIYERILHKVRD